MKKIPLILTGVAFIIVVLVIGMFVKTKDTTQETHMPMGKVGTENIDPQVVEQCNNALALKEFTDERVSDVFFADCLSQNSSSEIVARHSNNNADMATMPEVQNPVEFSGILQKVDTGCFADGECFIEVGGKHVTVLRGWTRDIVGKVVGGDNSIGGLEVFVGKEVEVYAHKLDEQNYTLYGDADYFVKVK